MVRELGMPEYTLHSLRHFVATQLLIEGQPINQVAEFLGHSPTMTLTLYGRHLDEEAMRKVGRAATRLVTPKPRAETTPDADGSRPRLAVARADVVDRAAVDALVMEFAERGPVTNALVQRETGLTRRQVSKALDRLVRGGKLIRRGTTRTTHYQKRPA